MLIAPFFQMERLIAVQIRKQMPDMFFCLHFYHFQVQIILMEIDKSIFCTTVMVFTASFCLFLCLAIIYQ